MTISALKYHNSTSYDRLKMDSHYLDWQNQPSLYKRYPGIDPLSLPETLFETTKSLSSLLKEPRNDTCQNIGIKDLSLILYLAYTITARARHGGEYFYYRSAASAGALYPTEIYVATNSISGLDSGLYHFSIEDHSLTLIRKIIQDDQIKEDNHGNEAETRSLTFFLTGIIFRSSWKYRGRAYRYNLLDTGHVIENLLLAIKATESPFNFTYDFDDRVINRFLGLDSIKEVALAIVDIPGTDSALNSIGKNMDNLPEGILNASRVSSKETPYPIIKETHKSGYEVAPEHRPDLGTINELGLRADRWQGINPVHESPEIMDYPEILVHRRSNRNFIKEPIKNEHLAALLDSLCIDDSHGRKREEDYLRSISTGFIAGNIEGFESGIYLMNRHEKSYGSVIRGFFMEQVAHICLDQKWLANAAVHFIFIGNLDIIDRTRGPRGYRYAMMTAGRMGQRIYLTATAMGIGCCGIGAFYDNEAIRLIGLNNNSRLLYLLAVGPVKSLIGK